MAHDRFIVVVALVLAGIASFITGASTVATKHIVATVGAEPLGVYRYGIGSLLLLGFLQVFHNDQNRLLSVAPRDLPAITVVGTISFCLFPIVYGTALKMIPASTGAFLFSTVPLWTAALSLLLGREEVRVMQWVGILLTLLGVALLTTAKEPTGDAVQAGYLGQGLMLFAAFLLALSGILVKPLLMRYHPMTLAAVKMSVGTVVLLPVALLRNGFFFLRLARLSASGIAVLLYLGVFGGAIGNALYIISLSRLSPSRVFVFMNVSPLVTTGLSVLVLGERLSGMLAIAALVTLAGVGVCQLSRAPRLKKEDRL